MTIRNLLFSIVGILSVLLVIVTTVSATRAFIERETARQVIALNGVGDLLLASGRHLIEERDNAVMALQADSGAVASNRDEALEQRGHALALLEEALDKLQTRRQSPAVQRLRDDVVAENKTVHRLRELVDANLARRTADRDTSVAPNWFAAMTALIERVEALRQSVSGEGHDDDAVTANYSGLKHFAWVMSDYAGRERVLLARSLNDLSPLSPELLQRLSDYRGRVELAWSALAAAAGAEGVDPAVKTAINETEQKFLGEFQMIRSEILADRDPSDGYPMSGPEWIAASTRAIDSLYRIEEALGAANERHLENIQASAFGWMVFLFLLLAFGMLSGAGSLWTVTMRVARPVRRMTEVMGRLAEGELHVEMPALDRTDEIGEMATAVQVFRQNAIDNMRLLAEQAEQEQRLQDEKRRTLTRLGESFEASVKGVVESVSSAAAQMRTTAQSMSANATQTNRQSSEVASVSMESSANVQTAATATEELSISIKEISRQVTESGRIAQRGVDDAEAINTTVQGLSEAAQRIGQVVNLISDIASQTNLLALNATIEAARAGEAGKGFAVVASEVKSLANQTAKATDEIAAQIKDMQSATGETVEAIEGICAVIRRINETATSIAAAMEEQDVSTQEIARNVQEAATGTTKVSSNIESVRAAAGETGTSAEQVLQAAEGLSRQSELLSQEVEKFLEGLRAA